MKDVSVKVPSNSEDLMELISTSDGYGCKISGQLLGEYFTAQSVRELLRLHLHEVVKNEKMLLNLAYFIDGFSDKPHHMADPSIDYDDYKDEKCPYKCIPLMTDEFVEELLKARSLLEDNIMKFVDAGCGVGDKVRLANNILNWDFRQQTFGVELSKFITDVAKGLHPMCPGSIINDDITTHNFEPYNIIYAYNPIQTHEGMYKFFENVARTAKKGTICIFFNVGSGYHALSEFNRENKKFKETRESSSIFIVK